jgi:hypothetical protein
MIPEPWQSWGPFAWGFLAGLYCMAFMARFGFQLREAFQDREDAVVREDLNRESQFPPDLEGITWGVGIDRHA